MPAPSHNAISTTARLAATQPWLNLTQFRAWANGGVGNLETDFDSIRFTQLPRPQLYGFPVNAYLAETQDAHGQQSVVVTSSREDSEDRTRTVIFGDALDGNDRCRVPDLMTRFRMPKYGRVTIEATFAHGLYRVNPYGGATDPLAYFSLFYGSAQGQTFTEIAGSRRYTRRRGTSSYTSSLSTAGSDEPLLEGSLQWANMLGALSTKAGASYQVTGDTDLLIFVGFTAPGSGAANTFFSTGYAGAGSSNRVRADVLNSSLMVRVWKNVDT